MFLEMQPFGSLKLLMALLDSSYPFREPIWSQNGPKIVPKSRPKNHQKVVQNITPKITKKQQILVSKMDPKIVQNGEVGTQANLDGFF